MYALLLNHKTWKFNFSVKLLGCKRNFFSRNFLGQLPQVPPKMGPQKINFLTAQARVLVLFDISRYLTDKYFDIVWGCPPPDIPKIDPQKSIFWAAWARVPVCIDISRYLTDKYFDIVWRCHPLPPLNWTRQKSIFWMAQTRVPVCFDIGRYLTAIFWHSLGIHIPLGISPNGPFRNQFLNGSS